LLNILADWDNKGERLTEDLQMEGKSNTTYHKLILRNISKHKGLYFLEWQKVSGSVEIDT
jgi:5S rRNA maturation endonuclease (ribonuclease M5)